MSERVNVVVTTMNVDKLSAMCYVVFMLVLKTEFVPIFNRWGAVDVNTVEARVFAAESST